MLIRQEVRVWLIHFFYLLFFLFLMNRLFFPSSGMAERSMSYLLYPFFKIHANLTDSLKHQAQDRKTLQGLRKELDALYVQYDVLQGHVTQLEAQQRFIQETQELIDFAARYQVDQKRVAKVLMCCCSPQEDVIFIDGGSNKNCAKDDIVVYHNALIGRVIEVYPWYSKVALITDQRCRIAAQISVDSSSLGMPVAPAAMPAMAVSATAVPAQTTSGICCGKNNKQLELCFVPHYKPVIVGDSVLSTGQGLVYPQGFALGVVQTVTTDLVSHKIQVKPKFDIANISYVYVLHKEAKTEPVPVEPVSIGE